MSPIAAGDIDFHLSVTTGPGMSTAQGDPNLALGEFISSTQIVDATLNNLFDDVSGDENQALESEYRCMFVRNAHGSLTLQTAVCWISAEVAGGADVDIGLDPIGVVADNSASAQAEEIGNEDTTPATPTFSHPTTKGTGLNIGNIGPSQVQAIWWERTTTNSAALNNDGATITVEGDTAA